MLKPGGWIAGRVPNRESAIIKMERKSSDIDYPPHHFLRFRKDNLKKP